jgi:hypothetical protein
VENDKKNRQNCRKGQISAKTFTDFLVKLRAELRSEQRPGEIINRGVHALDPVALYREAGGEQGYGRRFWCGTQYAEFPV